MKSCNLIYKLLAMAALCFGVVTPARAQSAPKHFVLVHGGWQGAWSWYKVTTALEAAGHKVTVVDLPSHSIDSTPPGTVTLQMYTDKVVQTLDAIPGKVVLVAHSMGGIVASSAAEARPAKIDKLVYVCAFLIPNGKSLLDVALTDSEALITANFIPDFAAGTLDVNRSMLRDIYYNNSPATDVALARSLFKQNALQPLGTPLQLTAAGWGSIRRFYIETLQDHAISLSVQRGMYAQTPVEKVYTLDTDHSPFFSTPVLLSAHLIAIANR